MNIKAFISCILIASLQCMIPLGIFDVPASPPPMYDSDIISLTSIFVDLPNESYDTCKVASTMEKVSYFPSKLIDKLIAKGEKMRLINGCLTDEPEYQHLKGKIPRGWEDTGFTWDDVPGIGGNPIIVKIDCCGSSSTHSSVCLELHEVAHRIDTLNVLDISNTFDFKRIWKSEAPILFENNPYFIEYCNEYFAECYAMYLCCDTTRSVLMERAPLTYQFFLQDTYNPLLNPDLAVYEFRDSKICGGLYKNRKYSSYDEIINESYFKSTDNIYIAFSTINYGKTTDKPFKISLWVDGDLIFETYQDPLEEGYICRLWNINIGKLPPGTHKIIYEADSDYDISEVDENNNWAEYKIQVE